MLVLARKKNDTIVINDQIVIEVLQIKGNTIRLGIAAPAEVRIARGELKPLPPTLTFEVTTDSEVSSIPNAASKKATLFRHTSATATGPKANASKASEPTASEPTVEAQAKASLAGFIQRRNTLALGSYPASEKNSPEVAENRESYQAIPAAVSGLRTSLENSAAGAKSERVSERHPGRGGAIDRQATREIVISQQDQNFAAGGEVERPRQRYNVVPN